MATSEELNALFRSAATAAEQVVRESRDDFTPWIVPLLSDDRIGTGVLCPATSEDEASTAYERVSRLADECMADPSFKAVAMVFDVRFKLKPSDPMQDAIAIEVVTPDGSLGRCLRPYRRDGNGVTFGEWKRVAAG